MTESELLPWIAGGFALAAAFYLSAVTQPAPAQLWIFPGALSVLFFLVSLRALIVEGPFGFWANHTQDLWGNQIWFDLLLGVSAAIAFIIPRARRMKMNVLFWTMVCLATGSIGLYAFISRLLFLESRKADELPQ